MPRYRMIGIALAAVVSLSQQPGVTWAAADQTPPTAPDSSILVRTSPAEPAIERDPRLKGLGRSQALYPFTSSHAPSLTMDRHVRLSSSMG